MVGDHHGMSLRQIAELLERNPRYVKHLPTLLRGNRPSKTLPDISRCIYLGDRIVGEPCGSPLLNCGLHGDVTSRMYPCKSANRCCNGCTDKVVVKPFAPKMTDHSVGVVIGSFRWPELVELQIRTIRDTCGPIPILVSNDDPESHSTIANIRDRYTGVTLDTNPERIGHIGGDAAAFWKGIRWGASLGLDAVVKLSQRFVVTKSRWLHDGATDLLASGLPMASRRCRGDVPYDLRTECVLMDVRHWSRPEVLARLAPRRYWNDEPGGLCAETLVYRILIDLLGGVFWPWASLMGEDRFKRDDGVIWHYSNPTEDYRRLAAAYGITISDGFHTGGWEKELEKGTYLYG